MLRLGMPSATLRVVFAFSFDSPQGVREGRSRVFLAWKDAAP